MAGKYAHIKLPKFEGTDPSYQGKVQEEKDLLRQEIYEKEEETSLSGSLLARWVVQQRIQVEEKKKALSAAALRLEALEQMLINRYEEEDVSSIKVTGAAVRVQTEPYAVVKDKEVFRLWCIANGLEKSLSLMWQSTNSITKDRLLAGQPEPDGVEAFTKGKVVVTRDK
ncbi:hypothetical protein LCGC14_1359450 [marine sediment metagenome]|uniref:Uncharacterized protein n=1 Tax=marine sediment metagenome TaxID=412755 RepID=A0A0F9K8J4_9ZZZZ